MEPKGTTDHLSDHSEDDVYEVPKPTNASNVHSHGTTSQPHKTSATSAPTSGGGPAIPITIRGKEGELEGSVTLTTTFDAVIKWYAKKKGIPADIPRSGSGQSAVAAKRLKIDFDGDLFDGAGKVVELDLDGGETLDIKYV